jgi:predicted DNA-binding transcriptional regulator YafY
MKNYIGLFNDDSMNIKLLINKPFSKSVSEGIFSEDQVIVRNEDGSIIFQGIMSSKIDIIRWILSMNTSVTVLEPIELKQEIKEVLTKMIETI